MVKIVRATPSAIARAAELIRRGRVVAYPTESSYGLAVNALDESALDQLLVAKGRPAEQTISMLVADYEMLGRVTESLSAKAEQLAKTYWPGPLTLILPALPDLPEEIVNPSGEVAVRISSDPIAAALVRAVGAPITTTSANLSGQAPGRDARSAAIVGVDLVLDDGPRLDEVSTLLRVDPMPAIVRHGAIEIDPTLLDA